MPSDTLAPGRVVYLADIARTARPQPRRIEQPESRAPDGSGVALGVMLGLAVWAFAGVLVWVAWEWVW